MHGGWVVFFLTFITLERDICTLATSDVLGECLELGLVLPRPPIGPIPISFLIILQKSLCFLGGQGFLVVMVL